MYQASLIERFTEIATVTRNRDRHIVATMQRSDKSIQRSTSPLVIFLIAVGLDYLIKGLRRCGEDIHT